MKTMIFLVSLFAGTFAQACVEAAVQNFFLRQNFLGATITSMDSTMTSKVFCTVSVRTGRDTSVVYDVEVDKYACRVTSSWPRF